MSDGPGTVRARRWIAWGLVVAALVALATAPDWLSDEFGPAPQGSFAHYPLLAAALGAWLVGLGIRDRLRLPDAGAAEIKRTHLIPIAVQGAIFVYWAVHWAVVRRHASHVLAQLAFAYVLDILIAWTLRRPWPALFAVVAPVLSANLFVWFVGDDEWESSLLVAIALVSKALLRRDGKHVFNPSAFGAAVLGVLVLTMPDHFGYSDIAFGLSTGPLMPEVMFLVTLVPLALLGIVHVAIGAVLVLSFLHGAFHGGPAFTWPGWFLAITIFAGDPATIPKTTTGRLLFGALIGAGLQAWAAVLVALTGMDYWAKVFPVPIANLLVPQLDRVGERVEAWLGAHTSSTGAALARRRLPLALLAWAWLFGSGLGSAKRSAFEHSPHDDGSPLACGDARDGYRCADNRMFCEPWRFDLEGGTWSRPADERCPERD
jgi:hypothetical protein